jgi:hypothetical protein
MRQSNSISQRLCRFAGLARYLPHAFGLAKHPKSFSGRDSITPPSNQVHPLAVNSDSPIGEWSNPNLARLLFVVSITMGDPAGIGPEFIMKSLDQAEPYDFCRPLDSSSPCPKRPCSPA